MLDDINTARVDVIWPAAKIELAAPRSPSLSVVPDQSAGTVRITVVPRARPGHFAEREELDAAIAKRSLDALRLFVERHPKSRYRSEAEALIENMQTGSPLR